MITLRPYQEIAVQKLAENFERGVRRQLLVLPTGGGKTTVASVIMRYAHEAGTRSLFVAHRDDLITRTLERLNKSGTYAGRIQAGYPSDPLAPVQVASVWTLESRPHELPPAGLVVVDEAHRAVSATFRAVSTKYPGVPILGLTATPGRSDAVGLQHDFDVLVEGPSVRELTELGVLVPARYFGPPEATAELSADPVEATECFHRKATVVFAASVAESRELARALCDRGLKAVHVDGDLDDGERELRMGGFEAGDAEIICNYLILAEGWDCTRVDTVVIARGVGSQLMFRQIVGRGLRAHEGKTDCQVVDLRGSVHTWLPVDFPVEHTLKGITRKKSVSSLALASCPQCGAIFERVPTCPRCGTWATVPKPPAKIKARPLASLSPEAVVATWAQKRKAFDALVVEAKENGFKPGWVGYRFKELYGEWPRFKITDQWVAKGETVPIPIVALDPDDDVPF